MLALWVWITTISLHRAFYSHGFCAPASQDSSTLTRTVASSLSPGAYAAPSLITPWWRNTWAHMSGNVFIFFYTERGNMFHNKCLHTLEKTFFFFFFLREKERDKLGLELIEALFLCTVFITQSWKELARSLGRICAKIWVPGDWASVECVCWANPEGKNQWIRGKNSQNLCRETKTIRYKNPHTKRWELKAGGIQEICH